MKRKVIVMIEEDCIPGLDYTITANGRHMRRSLFGNKTREYTAYIDAETCNIEIKRDEEWSIDSKLLMALYFLVTLALEGNSFGEDLPIHVQYSQTIQVIGENEICLTLKQSDIFYTTVDSISLWNKCAIMQMAVLGLIISVLGVLMSFLFSGLVQVCFILVIIAACALLIIAINKRISKLRVKLYDILNKSKEPVKTVV